MARVIPYDHDEPISAINITPFIDVLLVLLIMMILTIPVLSHKVPIDLPQGRSPTTAEETHQLRIDRAGQAYWDGVAVGDADLRVRLAAMRQTGVAVLHMNTDPEARYERFDTVLAMVKRAGIERLGFIGHRPLTD